MSIGLFPHPSISNCWFWCPSLRISGPASQPFSRLVLNSFTLGWQIDCCNSRHSLCTKQEEDRSDSNRHSHRQCKRVIFLLIRKAKSSLRIQNSTSRTLSCGRFYPRNLRKQLFNSPNGIQKLVSQSNIYVTKECNKLHLIG